MSERFVATTFRSSGSLYHLSRLLNRKLYHPNNAQLGMAMMRAGVTHWHAGQIEVGHSLICKAYGILIVTHGSNHAITRDLEVQHSNLCTKS